MPIMPPDADEHAGKSEVRLECVPIAWKPVGGIKFGQQLMDDVQAASRGNLLCLSIGAAGGHRAGPGLTATKVNVVQFVCLHEHEVSQCHYNLVAHLLSS